MSTRLMEFTRAYNDAIAAGATPEEAEKEAAQVSGATYANLTMRSDSKENTESIFNFMNVPNDALFWLLLLKLAKNNPASVERILINLFTSMGKALEAHCRAGCANAITAWGSSHLLALWMERFGLLTHAQTTGHILGLDIATGFNVGVSVAEAVAKLLPWGKTSDNTFPDVVVMGDTTYGAKVEKHRIVKLTKKKEGLTLE